MAVTTAQVQALYIAYFNRPADFFGLTFQVNQANQFGLQFVADQFSKSPEYLATYAGKGTGEIIDTIYMNLFGRHAEPAGLKFWGDLLTDPKSGVTIGNAALTIFNGALNDDKIAVTNKVTAAQAFYASLDTNAEIVGYSGDAANQVLKAWMGTITTDASLAAATTPAALTAVSTAAIIAHDGAIQVTTELTTGIDSFVGTGAADTIIAILDNVNHTDTLTALDTIDGGNGIDTLQINDIGASSAMPVGLTVKGVEVINVRGAGAVNVDASTFTGVTNLNVVQSAAATVKAGSTAAISVTGATGAIVATGGASQTLSSNGADITSSKSAGAVSATLTHQGAHVVTVDGGTAITVNATGETSGTITVGGTTAPTGAVIVNSTGAAAAGTAALGAITVTGGSAVVVTAHATSDASYAIDDVAGSTITEGAVTVNGSSKTTAVTVVQDATVAADPAFVAVEGSQETQVFTFSALTAGQFATIDGLTFTAAKALTAAQVAAAFANLTAGANQGSASASNGVYSGVLGANFDSGAVVTTATSSKVTFTQEDIYQGPVGAVAVAGVGVAAPAVTAGVAAVDEYDGTLGVTAGAVTVDGSAPATDVLAAVTLDGYGAAAVTSDALTSLSLANSAAAVTVNNTVATTLGLTLNHVTGNAALNLGGTYTTLNVNASTVKSAAAITAAGVTTLNVSGAVATDLTGSAMAALKTVTIAGAGGATLATGLSATITSIDASASSGSNKATIDTTKATYVGGTGADSVTLLNNVTTKAVSLGDGNDSLTLAAGTTTLTAVMDGGTGTDTLKMAFADATTASATSTFATKINSFEKLSLTGSVAAAADAVNLANMTNINYVISSGLAAGSSLALTKMGAAGTLELTGAAAGGTEAYTVTLADATGTADVFNLVTKVSASSLNFGEVKVAGVETVNITATDTLTSPGGIQTATVKLTDAAVKSIVVTGNGHLTLTGETAATSLTSLDGSAMTGKLIATANGTVAETIKGGAGADILTSAGTSDVLMGGAGADTLVVHSGLVSLTGGAGADTFDVSMATSNVNSYATITDLTASDMIKFNSGTSFVASKVVLADTAVFQDYANQAINLTDDGAISWFTLGGNTYVIEHNSADASTSFVNGQDIIVKITGVVDLSTASFSTTTQTLLIA